MTRDESLEAALLIQYVALVVASLFLARFVHAGLVRALPGLKPQVAPGEYANLLVVFLPTWVFVAERLGIHRIRALTGSRIELARRVIITQSFGLAAIALILLATQTSLNRSLIAVFLLLSTVGLFLGNVAQRRWIARRRGESLLLVVGDVSDAAAASISRARGRRVEVYRSLDVARLAIDLRAAPVDEIVLAGPLPADDVRGVVELGAALGLPVLAPIGGALERAGLPPPRVEAVGDAQYLVYQRQALDVASLMVKTVFDRLVAAALLVALSPLLLLLALAVRVFIGKPVFYLQRRGGLFGRPFTMLKFRTMRLGADRQRDELLAHNDMDGPVFKMSNDPRVTWFGRWLRRMSLDELPQLANVLAGHMSLVGPRPLPCDETQALTDGHRRRLAMRPGLTCLWQVSGRSNLTFAEWMTLDLAYVDDWTLGLDVAILLRTLPAILTGRGAR